jgi:hypothetical protein
MLLVFSVYEESLGSSILVSMIRGFGNDYFQSECCNVKVFIVSQKRLNLLKVQNNIITNKTSKKNKKRLGY